MMRAIRALVTLTSVCAFLVVAAGCGSGAPRPDSTSRVPERQPADPTSSAVPQGTIVKDHIASRSLGRQRYRIYLPSGYQTTAGVRYPVVYLLHGSTADESQWDDVGIDQAADCLIAAHAMSPTLIVLLDAGIAEHRRNGGRDVERFVVNEVVPAIDHRFRTLADRAHRAIGGISLGGGWALRIAADRRDRFSVVGGHSPATTLTDHQRTVLAGRQFRVWLDVGTGDGLRPRVLALYRALRGRGGEVTLEVWPGIHDRRYWSHHLQAYLRFYAARW